VDLNLYFRVLWRFRLIVAVGLVLAVAVAFASVAKIGANGSISYRKQPTWQGTTRLFVTQQGFPWGRTILPGDPTSVPGTPSTSSGIQFADPTRLAGLSVYYADLVNGDLIQRQIQESVPPEILKSVPAGTLLSATAVTDPTTNTPLALVDVTSTAHSPAQATRISRAGASLLQSYIAHQQSSAGIPPKQRVLLQDVSTKATMIAGRKKTLAIVSFMAVLIATIALAFVLENHRPRIQAVGPVTAAAPTERVGVRHTGS
jgi:capsular polysaccharide biosynthesis protein